MRFHLGGKNASGVPQWIINQIPPHRVYVEPFAGSAAVLRIKRPAAQSIALDRDPGAIAALRDVVPPATELRVADGLAFLEKVIGGRHVFIYCDPPYMHSARRSRHRYQHELSDASAMRATGSLRHAPAFLHAQFRKLAAWHGKPWPRAEVSHGKPPQ
jgi:hypothetical protein